MVPPTSIHLLTILPLFGELPITPLLADTSINIASQSMLLYGDINFMMKNVSTLSHIVLFSLRRVLLLLVVSLVWLGTGDLELPSLHDFYCVNEWKYMTYCMLDMHESVQSDLRFMYH